MIRQWKACNETNPRKTRTVERKNILHSYHVLREAFFQGICLPQAHSQSCNLTTWKMWCNKGHRFFLYRCIWFFFHTSTVVLSHFLSVFNPHVNQNDWMQQWLMYIEKITIHSNKYEHLSGIIVVTELYKYIYMHKYNVWHILMRPI